MANSKEANKKDGMFSRLRQELAPPKFIANVIFSLAATFVGGLATQFAGKMSLREYLWPWGILVFLLLLLLLLGIRLRWLAKTVITTAPVLQNIDALDQSLVVGRNNEIEQVVSFVRSDERKFLCLHGQGGAGKTTVARAALGRLPDLRQFFVEVDSVEERGENPSAVDEALGVAVAMKLAVPLIGPQSPVEAVAGALRELETRTVIVIDNVEQVRKRAAPIIHRWVQENPLARVIVTSRVELGVGTERVVEIDVFQTHPLNRDRAAIMRDPGPALKLFERRRADHHPGFKLTLENVVPVNRICDAVGGLALGIELAAPAHRTFAEIETGIRKSSDQLKSTRLPERQRSLAATIDWSLQLLSEESYAMALQLSTAPGELDDEAIKGITGSVQEADELVSELVDANLLVWSERGEHSSYREPVEVRRRCSELRLASPHEADRGAWSRFAATFVARGEAAYGKRYGPAVRQALDALEHDYNDLLAVAQCAEPTDPTVAARAAICLAWLIRIRRPSEPQLETLTALEAIVPGEQHAVLSQLRTALSEACLNFWTRTGEDLGKAALDWAQSAVKAGDVLGDRMVLGEAYHALAKVEMRLNHPARAASALDAAAQHFIAARQFAAAAGIHATWSRLPPFAANSDKLIEAKRLLGTTSSPLVRFNILLAELFMSEQSQTRPPTELRSLTNELQTIAEEVNATSLLESSFHATAVLESELDDQGSASKELEKRAKLQQARFETYPTPRNGLELGLTKNDQAAVLLRRRPLTDELLDRAIAFLDEALPLVEGLGQPRELALIRGNRGWALFNRGRPKEGLLDSKEAVRHFDDLLQWDLANAFIITAMHAQICAAAGEVSDAWEWARKAYLLAKERGYSETSTNPEIRRHAQWLRDYLA